MSEKGLDIFVRKKFLPIQDTSLKAYADYLTGKQYKVAFHKSSSHKRSYILDLIHIDVCTIDARTLDRALYFIIFIDDHARKIWIFVLKSKDQMFYVSKHFYASVEKK